MDAPEKRVSGKWPPAMWVAGAAVLFLIVLGWSAWTDYQHRAQARRLLGSGSIEATEVEVSPKVPGRVTRLIVEEGARIQAGQVLVELEPQEADAQVTQARAAVVEADAHVLQARHAVATQEQVTNAQVAQAQSQVTAAQTRVSQAETALAIQERTTREATSSARAQVSATRARVASAGAALTKARDDLRRAKALFSEGAIAQQQVDNAQAAYDVATAQERAAEETVRQAQAALASAQANEMQVAMRELDVRAARADLARARANLKYAMSGYTLIAQRQQDLAAAQAAAMQARGNLRYVGVIASHNTIVAPSDGVVLTKHIEAGEVVAAGTPIYTLINPQDIWLRVYIPEDQIGRAKLGQAAEVSVDTFRGRVFRGRVTEIRSQAEFTPGNVQAKEDRLKLMFGVKIQLPNEDNSLKPGMPADAEILLETPPERTSPPGSGVSPSREPTAAPRLSGPRPIIYQAAAG